MKKFFRKYLTIFVTFFIFSAVFLPSLVSAQTPPSFDPGGKIRTETGLGNESVEDITIGIINAVLAILGLITIAFIIYGGILWIFSGGNTETIKKAQGVLRASIIGLFIVLASYGIAQYVFQVAIDATT